MGDGEESVLAQKHVHEQGMKRQITGPDEQVLTWGPHHLAQGPSDVDNGILAEVTGENLGEMGTLVA